MLILFPDSMTPSKVDGNQIRIKLKDGSVCSLQNLVDRYNVANEALAERDLSDYTMRKELAKTKDELASRPPHFFLKIPIIKYLQTRFSDIAMDGDKGLHWVKEEPGLSRVKDLVDGIEQIMLDCSYEIKVR
jgi:hypothetical protein